MSRRSGLITERYYYESSRLLYPESLEAVARALGGELYIAVPDYGTLIFAEGADELVRMTLQTIAQQAYEGSSQPLSARVFRYREGVLSVLD